MTRVASEDEKILQETAVKFFEDKEFIKWLHEPKDNLRERTNVLWREIVDLGWTGLLVPEKFGGSDFGPFGMGLLLEAAGRSLTPTYLLHTSAMGSRILLSAGNAIQQTRHLSSIINGDKLFAFALDDGPHHQPTTTTTHAERSGSGIVLNGTKTFVPEGDIADLLVVSCQLRDEAGPPQFALLLLPTDSPGIVRKTSDLMNGYRVASIKFHSVECNRDCVLSISGDAFRLIDGILDWARVLVSAELIGATTRAFELTVSYLKERRQFNVTIGSFQALQHRAARMFSRIELARSCVYAALEALETNSANVSLLASLAKAQVGEAAKLVVREAVQMHGGIGMTEEHDIGLYFKHAGVLQGLYGTPQFHRDRYAMLAGF